MRLISSLLVALVTLATLAACGTKTPLSLPSPPQSAAKPATAPAPAPAPAADDSNKAPAEPRR